MKPTHVSVMVQAVIDHLVTEKGGVYLDCTVGMGGHAAKILEKTSPNGRLIGMDVDLHALALAEENLKEYDGRFSLIHGNYADLYERLDQQGVCRVDGLIMDLGVSSLQLDTPERGFSFMHDGPLDMRMDQTTGEPVSCVLNRWGISELAEIFREYGEERWAKRIAAGIIEARKKAPLKTTRQLAEIIEKSIPRSLGRKHPATRTFQSLRIYRNSELENLRRGLDQAIAVLRSGGRICVISFHSLEDRIVKHKFRTLERGCVCPPRTPICICGRKPVLKILTKRPVTPQESEININPRSRSAKLRVAEKL